MKKQLLLLVSCLLLFGTNSFSQDFSFSHPYAAPLKLNPALVGSEALSLRVLNTFSFSKSHGDLSVLSFSADFRVPKTEIGSGVYYQLLNFNDVYIVRKIGFPLSYKFALSKKIALKTAAEISFNKYHLNFPYYFPTNPRKTVDLALGMLLLSPKSYAGLAVHHITQPNISVSDLPYYIPQTIAIHTGTTFYLNSVNAKYKQSLLSGIVYRSQGPFKSISPNLYYNLEPLIVGLQFDYGFINSSYANASIGFRRKIFRLQYSYKWNTASYIRHNYHTFGLVILPFGKTNSSKYQIPFPLF